ncbi:MAG: hypothetical protein IJ876_01280 [Elusimicrobiaceae bacterium]|nr:hypothetical protein [Elusimicrobiaceae bacterium]
MKSLFKPTSYQQGTALAVAATLVWKAVSFANALLLALYFGATRQTDVYFYLIMLTGFGVAFLQRLNQTVLIPEAMFLAEKTPPKARSFLNMWLYLYAGLGIFLCIAAWGWAEDIWKLLTRFNEHILTQDKWMLTCGFLLFALQILTYYLLAVAEMFKFFKTAWLGVLNAICPLVCLLVFGNHIGIISMVYGFLTANILQMVILIFLFKTQLHWDFTPTWVSLRTQTRQNMLTGQTLAVLDMMNSLLPAYLISGMGAGLISALNYCKQFTDSATEVFTSRAANIAKIEMTEQCARQQSAQMNETFLRTTFILLAILAPLVVFSCYFAPFLVELFFKRGHFGQQAVLDTTAFLRPMLLILLLSVPGYLQNSTLAASRKIKEGFPYALTSGLILTALLLFAIPHYGAFSYPYVLGIGLLIGFVLNAFLFRKELPFLQYVRPFVLCLRLSTWAALALLPATLLGSLLPPNCWTQLLGCGIVYVVFYGLVLYVSKDGPQLLQFLRNGF